MATLAAQHFKTRPSPRPNHAETCALADKFWQAHPDSLHDVVAVAAAFDCSRTTLDLQRLKNEGPTYVRVTPNLIRYRKQDVLDYINRNRYAATAEDKQ